MDFAQAPVGGVTETINAMSDAGPVIASLAVAMAAILVMGIGFWVLRGVGRQLGDAFKGLSSVLSLLSTALEAQSGDLRRLRDEMAQQGDDLKRQTSVIDSLRGALTTGLVDVKQGVAALSAGVDSHFLPILDGVARLEAGSLAAKAEVLGEVQKVGTQVGEVAAKVPAPEVLRSELSAAELRLLEGMGQKLSAQRLAITGDLAPVLERVDKSIGDLVGLRSALVEALRPATDVAQRGVPPVPRQAPDPSALPPSPVSSSVNGAI